MSDPQAQLDLLKERGELWKLRNDQKHSLINDLFTYIDDLHGNLADAEYELHDKKDVIKLNRKRIEEQEKRINTLQLEKSRFAFASVVIDGDCMPFKDELVKQGLDGGKKAASLLGQAVEKELKSMVPTAIHHLQVVVRVYANVKGLAKTYKEMEILSESTFDEFVRGFNMSDTCDYVDAGNGKECADEKVKANVRFYLSDTHCEKVIFGGSADNGYARLLEKYLEDEIARGRIILLEGPPFAHELAAIKDRFRTVSFGDVFRGQKLQKSRRKVLSYVTALATPLADYARDAGRTPLTPTPASTIQQGLAAVNVAPLRNKLGQRVDPRLAYSQQDFVMMKSRKLCNQFYLLGKCDFLDNKRGCSHQHDASLNSRQLTVLRAVARQSPCSSGLYCDSQHCISGHRCTRDSCIPATCRFPSEMHNVDTTIVGLVGVSQVST